MSIDQQLSLKLPDGVFFSEKTLVIKDDLTYSEWIEMGQFLSRCEESLTFWIADWLDYGKKKYSPDEVNRALGTLGLAIKDLQNELQISSLGFREPMLSRNHHLILSRAQIDNIGKRYWADIAVKEKLSWAELGESIRKGHIVRIPEHQSTGSAGVATWQGLAMQFDLLRRQIGDKWKDWSAAEIGQVLMKMGRMLDFITTLQMQKRELEQAREAQRAGASGANTTNRGATDGRR